MWDSSQFRLEWLVHSRAKSPLSRWIWSWGQQPPRPQPAPVPPAPPPPPYLPLDSHSAPALLLDPGPVQAPAGSAHSPWQPPAPARWRKWGQAGRGRAGGRGGQSPAVGEPGEEEVIWEGREAIGGEHIRGMSTWMWGAGGAGGAGADVGGEGAGGGEWAGPSSMLISTAWLVNCSIWRVGEDWGAGLPVLTTALIGRFGCNSQSAVAVRAVSQLFHWFGGKDDILCWPEGPAAGRSSCRGLPHRREGGSRSPDTTWILAAVQKKIAFLPGAQLWRDRPSCNKMAITLFFKLIRESHIYLSNFCPLWPLWVWREYCIVLWSHPLW